MLTQTYWCDFSVSSSLRGIQIQARSARSAASIFIRSRKHLIGESASVWVRDTTGEMSFFSYKQNVWTGDFTLVNF